MAIQNLNELATPEQFINFYHKELKTELSSEDLQISKVGLIGYMMQILGNTQYDVKQYYNYLFNEAFPVSAIDNANLIEHATLFGFNYDLAKSATLNGIVKFNFDTLLLPGADIGRREIYIDNLVFMIDNMQYIMDSSYVVTMVKISGSMNWSVQVSDRNGRKKTFPLIYTNAYTSLVDFNQYSVTNESYTVPLYEFGTFYPIKIDIPPDQDVCEINIRIKEVTSSVEEDFEVRVIKNFSEATDPHVFYKIYESSQGSKILLLELGSGYQGRYIPKSNVYVNVRTTYGEKGNIGITNINSNLSQDLIILDYPFDPTRSIIQTQTTVNNLLQLEINNGSGGINILKQEKLRSALIEYIQHRENLISETDYYQIIKNNFKYYEIMFKKTTLHENIIYVYITLLDNCSQPLYTDTKVVNYDLFMLENESNTYTIAINQVLTETYIDKPIISIDEVDFICPFLFKMKSTLNSYSALLVRHNFFQYYNSIIENDIASIISKSVGSSLSSIIPYQRILPQVYLDIDVEFTLVDDISTVVTNFYLKSSESLQNFSFKIIIPVLNINGLNDGDMVFEDDSYINVKYVHHGLVTEPFTVTIKVYDTVSYILDNNPLLSYEQQVNVFDLKFENVHYILDIQDIFRLKTIIYNNPGDIGQPEKLVLSIPLISKEQYDMSQDEIVEELFSKLSAINLENTRLITDDPQIRFLNSYRIFDDYLTQMCPLDGDYEFNLYFPLKVFINLTFNKQYVIANKVDLPLEVENIKYAISEFLNNKKTGTQFYFYKSSIDDIIHNFLSVKGATVIITDNTGVRETDNSITGTIIPNGDLVIRDQNDLIDTFTKYYYLKYTPSLFWWDINNISIVYETM
jgi:hypothetical protein